MKKPKNRLSIISALTNVERQSFNEIKGLSRMPDLPILALIVTAAPDIISTAKDAPVLKKYETGPKNAYYGNVWFRFLDKNWMNYDPRTDRLNLALHAMDSLSQNDFVARHTARHILHGDGALAYELADGKGLGLPGNKSIEFIYMNISEWTAEAKTWAAAFNTGAAEIRHLAKTITVTEN